jgi:hypothetical protein
LILVCLSPWWLPVIGGLSLCVLYEPGERLTSLGYGLLVATLAPLVIVNLVTAFLHWWRPYLDVNCTWCGRPFFANDLPTILQTERCPGCGQPVPREDFEDHD